MSPLVAEAGKTMDVCTQGWEGRQAERRAGGWADRRAEGYAAMYAFGGQRVGPGNTKRGSITVPLTSCLTC
jgi:hypothetical protein